MKKKVRLCACGYSLTGDNTDSVEHLKIHSKYIQELINGKKK